MLGFFRKYQKFFFLIVTFFIVVSFVFFGVSNTFTFKEEEPNREIGKLVDGSLLMEKELHALIRLIQHGMEEGGRNLNLLNDSFVHREILVSGLAEVLVNHDFALLKEDLQERWRRVKHYTPYQHPYAPYISAKNVWSQYAPEINALLEEIRNAPEEFSKEELPWLFKLYQAQAQFPAFYLHQVLYYQEEQNGEIRRDPSLPQLNVALFGFESVEDWFGDKFSEQLAKLLLNASKIAKEEGYTVSREEAHIDMLSNIYRGLKAMGREPARLNEEVQNIFVQQIRAIGLSMDEAIDLWRGVMQFKRQLSEVGESVFIDRLAFDQFKAFAKASNKITRYFIPEEWQLTDFQDLMRFQYYLEVTHIGDYMQLPSKKKSADDVMKEHSELVTKRFDVEIARVRRNDVESRISLKKTWEWEVENFAMLQENFSSLSEKRAVTTEERYVALDALGELERFRVDQFARASMVRENPKLISEALANAPFQKETIAVGLKDGLFSGEEFLRNLANGGIDKYSFDNETYCSIHVLDQGKDWEVLSYQEGVKSGVLDEMVERLLLAAYEGMEIEAPFEEVREEVGEKLFADLLIAIKAETKEEIKNRDDYARHRFDGYLRAMRQLAMTDQEAFKSSPWALEEREEYLSEDNLSIGEYSEVAEGSFFKLIVKENPSATDADIAKAKELLKRDAQKTLLKKIISRL